MTENLIDETKLAGITLDKGAHSTPKSGLCLMEAVAYVRGIEHTDHPPCVSPVLSSFGRGLNDVLPDDLRQELVPFIVKLPGTVDDGKDPKRAFMAADWAVRVLMPVVLDAKGLSEAQKLRDLSPVVDVLTAGLARDAAGKARDTADADAAYAGRAAADAATYAAYTAAAAADAAYAGRAAAYAARAAADAADATPHRQVYRMAIYFFTQLIDP